MPDTYNGKREIGSPENGETSKGGSLPELPLPERNTNDGFEGRLPRAVMMLLSELHSESNGATHRLSSREEDANAPLKNGRAALNGTIAAPSPAPIKGGAHIPRWKRALDISCILLTSPFWLTLMIVIAIWIKMVSRGPVLFRQERIGYRGARFMILKFRSMQVNVETRIHEGHLEQLIQSDRPMTKLDAAGDPRLILGARILRATGLDELPQIFNVLRGEMSIVGPRPCTPHEFQRYQRWQRERVNTPPGLTGYWQVNGKNKTTFSQMIEMDLLYADRMSARLDLLIMLKTFPAITTQVLEARARANARTWNKQSLVEQQER